mgnify:FL=1|jgi:hypothetical protein
MRQIYGTTEGRLQEIDAADAALFAAIGKYGATLWADTRDINQARGTPVSTWQSRVGANCVQPTVGKQPLFYPGGFPDGGPCLDFNGVSDYLECAEDMSSTGKATVLISYHKDAAVNLFEVLVEYGTYYAGPGNGWTIMGSTIGAADRMYLGIGANPAYADSYYNGAQVGTKVLCATYDTALAIGDELALFENGAFVPPDSTGVGAGAAGNFSASALTIGARLNGGSQEREADALIREVVVMPDVVETNDLFALAQHMRVKAGLK